MGNTLLNATGLVAATMLFLVHTGVMSFNVSLERTSSVNIAVALALLGVLTYYTVRELRKKAPLHMQFVLSWALVLGIPIGSAPVEYYKHYKQQAELEMQAAKKAEKIAKAKKICQKFPKEDICKLPPPAKHNLEWAAKVEMCFTRKPMTPFITLPNECDSFGGSVLEDFIPASTLNDDSELLTSIKPPEALADQVREGEELAKAITQQALVTSGEFLALENYGRLWKAIDDGLRAIGCLGKDADDPKCQGKSEAEHKKDLLAILRGQIDPEIKAEIESGLSAVVGLSLEPEKLTEEQKQGVGLLIGVYNHMLGVYDQARSRVKNRAKKECSKYNKDELRPSRCSVFM